MGFKEEAKRVLKDVLPEGSLNGKNPEKMGDIDRVNHELDNSAPGDTAHTRSVFED